MSKTSFLESHTRKEDNQAATSIIFEIAKGDSNKIVWFSNLTQIVDEILLDIKKNTVSIEDLRSEISRLSGEVKNIYSCMFALTDGIDKLEKKLRKNHYKLGDILALLEDDLGN